MLKKIRFIIDNAAEALWQISASYALISSFVEGMYVPLDKHYYRVTELLEANNKGVEERRALLKALEDASQIIEQLQADCDKLKEDWDRLASYRQIG